jgi:hypothetical protein
MVLRIMCAMQRQREHTILDNHSNKHNGKARQRRFAATTSSRWPPLGKPKGYASDLKLHDSIREYIREHLDFVNASVYHLLACFVKATYLWDKFDYATYLAFIGDVGTGKSEALQCLKRLCHKGYLRDRPTPAVLFTVIDRNHPTLLLDNAHRTSPRYQADTISILDSGYKKDTKIDRTVNWRGKDYDILSFDVFGPKAFASNEEFVERSLTTRCITVYTAKNQRKVNHSYDERKAYELRCKCLKYAQLHKNDPLPEFDNKYFKDDRLMEIFYPLLCVADTPQAKKALLEIGLALDAERGHDFESEFHRTLASISVELSGKDGKQPFKLREVRKRLEAFGDTYSGVSEKTLGSCLKSFGCVSQREGSGDREWYYVLPSHRRVFLRHRYSIGNDVS